MTKQGGIRKVSEAAVAYLAERRGGPSIATISSKNQIALPARLLRELGLGPGDRVAINLEAGRLVLRPRPKDWVSYHAGSLHGLYGRTRKEIDAHARELREEGEREERLERAWSGEPAS